MKILGIETSCDETAVCIIEAQGGLEKPQFKVLGDALYSQVKTHAKYGGVFPMLAKREHQKNLIPLFRGALEEAELLHLTPTLSLAGEGGSPSPGKEKVLGDEVLLKVNKILAREEELLKQFLEFIPTIEKPDIDLISVTYGPGLEPALWVGINFAHALSEYWNIPLVGENHMEGHIVSPLLQAGTTVEFPALALLISGGHTELVLLKNWSEREIIGRTRDDAIGEAFDKVARLLGLPYPGGPEISKLAAIGREKKTTPRWILPRPMIKSPDYDFSFSGIKTAVLYTVQKISDFDNEAKIELALEFENAVTEVLIYKTRKALEEHHVRTLILGGGVIANTHIRQEFKKLAEDFGDIKLLIPDTKLATDNAIMIAAAAYLNYSKGKIIQEEIKAEGNLSFARK